MGLDMYLKGEKYVSEYFDPALKEAVDALLPDSILSGKVCGIKFRLAYWRKANAIHQWFVNNVQDGTDDCSDYDVSREKLQELVDTCKAVLADHKSRGIAAAAERVLFRQHRDRRLVLPSLAGDDRADRAAAD